MRSLASRGCIRWGCSMLRSRYAEWIVVWSWFQTTDRMRVVSKADWNEIYELLNSMWHEEREKDATPEELAAHAGAMSKFRQ